MSEVVEAGAGLTVGNGVEFDGAWGVGGCGGRDLGGWADALSSSATNTGIAGEVNKCKTQMRP